MHPLVAVEHGAGLDAGEVGAGVGLGVALAPAARCRGGCRAGHPACTSLPHANSASSATAGREFPFGLSRQFLSSPLRVRLRVLERHMNDRMIEKAVDGAVGPARGIDANQHPRRTSTSCTGLPRSTGPRVFEHRRCRDEQLQLCPGRRRGSRDVQQPSRSRSRGQSGRSRRWSPCPRSSRSRRPSRSAPRFLLGSDDRIPFETCRRESRPCARPVREGVPEFESTRMSWSCSHASSNEVFGDPVDRAAQEQVGRNASARR